MINMLPIVMGLCFPSNWKSTIFILCSIPILEASTHIQTNNIKASDYAHTIVVSLKKCLIQLQIFCWYFGILIPDISWSSDHARRLTFRSRCLISGREVIISYSLPACGSGFPGTQPPALRAPSLRRGLQYRRC